MNVATVVVVVVVGFSSGVLSVLSESTVTTGVSFTSVMLIVTSMVSFRPDGSVAVTVDVVA